jgi:membrane associated rhomboid family serine protease
MLPIPVTYIIIGITLLFSIPAMNNADLKWKMMFNAYQIKHRNEWYRFFSHALIHADWMHLFMNMYVLYMFGIMLEHQYADLFDMKAQLFYVLLYVGAIACSSLYSYEKHKDDMHYNALGASGAVSAVVFAHILIDPSSRLGLLFIPIMLPGWVFGGLYLFYSWYMGKKGADNIGHDAHFWGAVFGIVFTLCLKPSLGMDFIKMITG